MHGESVLLRQLVVKLKILERSDSFLYKYVIVFFLF